MDQRSFQCEVVCLKESGELGQQFRQHVVVHEKLLSTKYDARVLPRLTKLMQGNDAVITVGAGDKMFWGRLAAWRARVPVICSALHSTGWPDGVGRLNRQLTGITDGFIACAKPHAKHLIEREGFPASKVFSIPNGVDTQRFHPDLAQREWLRSELNLPVEAELVGIVAALREEKNHLQFVQAAWDVLRSRPNAHFVIVGDGPERPAIESRIRDDGLSAHFHLLGSRSDTARILAGLDIFCLTSKNEANPVSILEAFSCGIPVVSPRVGSVPETVIEGQTGILTAPRSSAATTAGLLKLLGSPYLARQYGAAGRRLVEENWSLEVMVRGYERLLARLYNRKAELWGRPSWQRPADAQAAAAQTESPALTAQLPQFTTTTPLVSDSPTSH